ncbi:MAG: hypothetical protein J7557_20880 [Devosia sp.]|nr:hypothetical protein [Devosia sp.]
MPKILFITSILLTAFATPAHAYLDPGTGSMLLQAIIGAVAVAGATLSMYWRQLRDKFSFLLKRARGQGKN